MNSVMVGRKATTDPSLTMRLRQSVGAITVQGIPSVRGDQWFPMDRRGRIVIRDAVRWHRWRPRRGTTRWLHHAVSAARRGTVQHGFRRGLMAVVRFRLERPASEVRVVRAPASGGAVNADAVPAGVAPGGSLPLDARRRPPRAAGPVRRVREGPERSTFSSRSRSVLQFLKHEVSSQFGGFPRV